YPFPAGRPRARRLALGRRHLQLRCLRGLARRNPGEVVHGARRDGRRAPGAHGGGHGRRRPPRPGAAGVCPVPRAAVRLLHAGDDAHRALAARPQPRSHGRGDPRGAVRPGLPVHGLREHRACRAVGEQARGGRAGTRPGGGNRRSRGQSYFSAYGPAGRKEDARFIRGRGTFVDDVQLPGMLHGAILRSPLAHARIRSVDAVAAQAHPKVRAVITGETLAARGLAWMPTLSRDVQAVLATDKVRFQGQEVAFVVAEDRYAARDALELINVDYEPLPAVIDAERALGPGAPVIRDDVAGKADNHIFDWVAGDRAAADAAFAAADVVVAQHMLYPRVHPAPLETCGAVADMDEVSGKLTVWSTSQAPHAHRTLYSLFLGLPEHKIRIISPDIGGRVGSKAPVYPGYICAIVGSQITGRPVKWMEDRSENLMSTAFARDYHMRGEIAAARDGTILALRVKVLADHGAFNGAAQPTKYPAGFF